MQLRFDHRVVIVTGAAQGIGAAIARAFLDAGAAVHLVDRDADGLGATADALRAHLGARAPVESHVVDLSERARTHGLVDAVVARAGRLDVAVNAAGGVCGQTGRPIEAVDEADWHTLFAANVDGAFWLAQAAAVPMKQAGSGRLVHIASGAGLRPSLTGIQAYAAAKHALVGLTRQLSLELAPAGITVNAVAPGFVLSNPTTRRQWERYGADGQARLVEATHTRRLGTAEDIAAAVLFFASDAAAWITGQVLSVDGGRS